MPSLPDPVDDPRSTEHAPTGFAHDYLLLLSTFPLFPLIRYFTITLRAEPSHLHSNPTSHSYLRPPCRLSSCRLKSQSGMVQDTVYRCIPPCLTWKGPTSSDLCLRLVQDLAFIDDDCTSTYMNGKLSILHCEHYTALQGAKRPGGLYKGHKVSQVFRRFADGGPPLFELSLRPLCVLMPYSGISQFSLVCRWCALWVMDVSQAQRQAAMDWITPSCVLVWLRLHRLMTLPESSQGDPCAVRLLLASVNVNIPEVIVSSKV